MARFPHLVFLLLLSVCAHAQSVSDVNATSATTNVIAANDPQTPAGAQTGKAAAGAQDKKPAPAPAEKNVPFKTDERPLGSAGPSRDEKTNGDGDYRVITDRWRIGFPDDPRQERGSIANPYRQNILKGDYPIIGRNTFLNVTLSSESTFLARRLPVPQDVSSRNPGSFEFFGRGRQDIFSQTFIMSFDLFHGDTSYKPADWRLHITPVFNVNYIKARENGIVNIDPRRGVTRTDSFTGFEEMSLEFRLGDTTQIIPFLRGRGSVKGRSPAFDFTSVRVGVQQFNSDFRGLIFNDANLGARLFGNYAANRYQFNVAYFNMLEKDTNSQINRINFEDLQFRSQKVWIANLYRQDTFVKGYTTQFSLHYNTDQPSVKYDTNGFLVRPVKIGDVGTHHVRSGYFGWAGDGHFGKYNVNHAFYQVIGRDTRNPIASKPVRINAQLAAFELSQDRDWLRPRIGVYYASGDTKPTDNVARGFDAIVDNSNFAGGKFSFWSSQGIRLTQTASALVEPNSLLPSLRSSKTQGQSNFINPGITIYNAGLDADITPKLRGFLNYNYLRFNTTEPIKLLLFQPNVRKDIGNDLGLGFIYRPLLNENIIVAGGVSGLLPGRGFTDIYSSNCAGTPAGCGAGRPPLWASFITLKFTY